MTDIPTLELNASTAVHFPHGCLNGHGNKLQKGRKNKDLPLLFVLRGRANQKFLQC